MATWSIKYPLNISPLGTNRQQGFEKHVLEFTEVYNYLNAVRTAQAGTVAPSAPEVDELWLDTSGISPTLRIWTGSSWVALMPPVVTTQSRCSVISGDNDSAILEGSGSSTDITLKASASKPVLFSFTDGFNLMTGDTDYIGYLDTDTVVTGAVTSATSYVYANRDTSTGGITLGLSTLPLIVQDATPASTAAGQHWYTPIHGKMYVYASGWVATQRVFVGEAVTTTASVSSVSVYAYNSVANKYPYLPLDAIKAYVGANAGGGASIGTGNYIAEPFAVTAGIGLEVSVAANRCVIDETVCESTTATTVALTAKAAQLIYKKKDNTYDKLLPKMSASDLVDANTVGLWITDGSANVPNAAVGVNGNTLAVANDLIRSGAVTAVDGWAGGDAAKGDGSTGYYTSANSTGFRTYGQTQSLSMLLAVYGVGAAQHFFHNGPLSIYIDSSGTLIVAGISTGYVVETSKRYLIEISSTDGVNSTVYINGVPIYSGANIANNTVFACYVFTNNGATNKATVSIDFVELRNALRPPAQIAALAQKLLIPCAYGTTDIRDAFANKAESQAVAFVIASATAPTTIIDPSNPKGPTPDWAYGMRIGPMGLLNRIKSLGKVAVINNQRVPTLRSPFGAGANKKITVYFMKTVDSAAKMQYGLASSWGSGMYAVGTLYSPDDTAIILQTPYNNLALWSNGSTSESSGYIECIVEVID